MEKEYYEVQIKYINEARSIRHDIQAHMIILKRYLETEQYEKALDYLKKMQEHQSVEKAERFETGNDLVNVIVMDTMARSKKRIRFCCKGMLPEKMPMDDYDICTLFSNAISNACEACDKLTQHSPVIQMEIEERGEGLLVAVQNPVEWSVDLESLGKATSKEDKETHGYGVKNMIEVVKQNHGKIDFYVTGQSFRVELLLLKKW